MSDNNESVSSTNPRSSTLPEHAPQPRSSIALGKRPANERTNHDFETAPRRSVVGNISIKSSQATGQMQALRYSPLRPPNIRLISISPSMQDGMLKLFLKEARLTDQLDFHALSYVWGDSTDKKTIIVNDQLLDITQNLYDFLDTTRKHEPSFLSHHGHPNYHGSYTSKTAQTAAGPAASKFVDSTAMPMQWWIDAICIRQDDIEEKNEQVPRMGDIYSMASQVWIWTGLPSKVFRSDPGFAELKQAIAFHKQDMTKWYDAKALEKQTPTPLIKQFADHQRQTILEASAARMRDMGFPIEPGPITDIMYRIYTQIEEHMPSQRIYIQFNNFLRQLADLLGQPYFGRTWIIQEYVLNPRPPIALLGNFVFDLDIIANLGFRLPQERQYMDKSVQVYAQDVMCRSGNLATIVSMRDRWHNLQREGLKLSEDLSEFRQDTTPPKQAFSRLPSGERLNYLLHAFFTRQCTNKLDYFYGILGLTDYRELPQSLLPDYSLSVEQVSTDYTRYIVESTRDLRMIEASFGHQSADCPSWVPDVKYLTALDGRGVAVSGSNRFICFSNDGRRLTLEGTPIGEVISCSCTACPTEYTDKHLEFVEEVLLEGTSQITGRTGTEVFASWFEGQLNVEKMLLPSLADITSMADLLQRYRDVCSDIPLDVQACFNRMQVKDMHLVFDTPCRDPGFLYAFLRLARMRYCLLSTGDIVLCALKGSNNTATSPTHRWDDSAWALKGFHQLAILRPKDDGYEYCGPMCSANVLLRRTEIDKEKPEFTLDDDFFAAREVRQVVLV